MAPAPAAGTGAGFSDVPSQPQVNFLSIERAPPLRGAGRAGKYYRYAADPRACCASSRGGQWGLTNVRIIRTDAATFLANFIPDSFVDCFHIYFPDPWPKKTPSQKTSFLPSQSRTTSPLSEDRRQFKNSHRLSRIF